MTTAIWGLAVGERLRRTVEVLPEETLRTLRVYQLMVDGRWHHALETDRALIPSGDPAFAAALAIYQGDRLIRAELEARVLANEPAPRIAEKMAVTPEVVETYLDWFFYARPTKSNWLYIDCCAIGRQEDQVPFGRHEIGLFWKWIAWNFGLKRLEQLLVAVDPKILRRAGIDAYWERDADLELPFKVAIALERLPRIDAGWAVKRRTRVFDKLRAQLAEGNLKLPAPLARTRVRSPRIPLRTRRRGGKRMGVRRMTKTSTATSTS